MPSNPEVLAEIRQIAAELNEFPFERRTWYWLTDENGARGLDGNAAGGHANITPGHAGAPVYHDIINEGGRGTRADIHEVCDRILTAAPLLTKRHERTAAAIRYIAYLRLVDPSECASPALPPGSGAYYTPVYRFPARTAAHVRSDADVLAAGGMRARALRSLRGMQRRSAAQIGEWVLAVWRTPTVQQSARGDAWLVAYAQEAWRAARLELPAENEEATMRAAR